MNTLMNRTFKWYISIFLIFILVFTLFPFYAVNVNAESFPTFVTFADVEEDKGAYEGQLISDIVPTGVSHIAIKNVDDTNGQWQWFSGTQWLNISDRLSSGNALVLSATTKVRFSATQNWNGTTTFEYVHFISGDSTDLVNYETELRTAQLTVTPVADAPYLTELGGNNYLGFSALNAYAAYPSMDIYSNSFTFESWVKIPYDMNAWERIFDTSFGTDNFNIHLAFEGGSRKLVLEALPQNGVRINTYQARTTDAFPINKWVHVAAVYNNEQKQAYIYWNGVLKGQGSMDLSNLSNASIQNGGISRPNNYLGKSTWNQDGYFKGGMKHVRFWNKAKSQSEIINEMSTVLSQTNPNLLSQYVLDEGTGNVAVSKGSISQSLVLSNTSWLTEDGFIYDVTGTVGSTRVKDFTVWDVDSGDVDHITVSAVSSDQNILPNSAIQIIGTGEEQKIIMRPIEEGMTSITVTLNDGVHSYSSRFNMNVTSLPAGEELDEPVLPEAPVVETHTPEQPATNPPAEEIEGTQPNDGSEAPAETEGTQPDGGSEAPAETEGAQPNNGSESHVETEGETALDTTTQEIKGSDERINLTKTTEEKGEQGKTLPKTATNIYNILAFGLLVAALGIILLLTTKKRKID